jgi:hypothetical protein
MNTVKNLIIGIKSYFIAEHNAESESDQGSFQSCPVTVIPETVLPLCPSGVNPSTRTV